MAKKKPKMILTKETLVKQLVRLRKEAMEHVNNASQFFTMTGDVNGKLAAFLHRGQVWLLDELIDKTKKEELNSAKMAYSVQPKPQAQPQQQPITEEILKEFAENQNKTQASKILKNKLSKKDPPEAFKKRKIKK